MFGSHVGGKIFGLQNTSSKFLLAHSITRKSGLFPWEMGRFKFLIIGFLLLHKLDWGRASGYHHGRATTHGLLKENNMYVFPTEKYHLQT